MPTYDRVHLASCLADAVRSAVENLRDDPAVSHLMFHTVINGGEYNGYSLYSLAYSYLEDGLVRCSCGAIPTDRQDVGMEKDEPLIRPGDRPEAISTLDDEDRLGLDLDGGEDDGATTSTGLVPRWKVGDPDPTPNGEGASAYCGALTEATLPGAAIPCEVVCTWLRDGVDGYQHPAWHVTGNEEEVLAVWPYEKWGEPLEVRATSSTEPVPPFKSNSILEERENGFYYTGPLEPAKQAMIREYGDDLTIERHDEGWTVTEHRGTVPDNPNQWGLGATEEEAWRYLIGGDFGPLDETYEAEGYEANQRRMLGLDADDEPEPVFTRVVLDVDTTGTRPVEMWDWDDLVGLGTRFVRVEGATSSTEPEPLVEGERTPSVRELFRAAYDLIGDGQGGEWDVNSEYTRGIVELLADTCGVGLDTTLDDHRAQIEALIRRAGTER